MLQNPWAALGHLCLGPFLGRAMVVTAVGAVHVGLVSTLLVPIVRDPCVGVHQRQVRRAQHTTGVARTRRAGHVLFAQDDAVRSFEGSVFWTFVFVDRHLGSLAWLGFTRYLTTAKSTSEVTDFCGPLALGLMSNEKISVGKASVAHALGMSTMPLMRPSMGAVPKMA